MNNVLDLAGIESTIYPYQRWNRGQISLPVLSMAGGAMLRINLGSRPTFAGGNKTRVDGCWAFRGGIVNSRCVDWRQIQLGKGEDRYNCCNCYN